MSLKFPFFQRPKKNQDPYQPGKPHPMMAVHKKLVLKRMKIKPRMDHNFRIEIDGQPDDLDLFAKDISYGMGTIESRTIELRTGDINIPDKKSAGAVTVVFTDCENGKISEFIQKKFNLIFNDDGTQNLPIDYLFNLRIYRISQ